MTNSKPHPLSVYGKLFFAKSVILVLLIFSSSCKKDTVPESLSAELKTFDYEPPKEAVIPLIKNFLKNSIAYKTTSTTDETQAAAVWLSEAAANYGYDSEPTGEYSLEYETITLSVDAYDDPISGERMIDGTSLMAAYNTLDQQLQTIASGMGVGEGILIIDIEPDVANQTNVSTDFKVQVAMYSLNLIGVGANDDWEAWGMYDGIGTWSHGAKCDGSQPNYGGAPRRLTDLINYNYQRPNADFFTSIQIVNMSNNNSAAQACCIAPINGTNFTNWFFGNPGSTAIACTSSEPNREIFEFMQDLGTTCINNTVLQMEYNNLWRLIDLETPTNKHHISSLVSYWHLSTPLGHLNGYHNIQVAYGIPQINSTN